MDETKDQPVAAVIDPESDEQLDQERRRQREAFWKAVERIRERNRHFDPDYVLAEVTKVVEEVRQEQYEREQRKAERCR